MEPKTSKVFSQEYDRYCRQIDKEDNLMDQRINWLLMSQSILFAAVGVSDASIAKITLKVVPFVGIGCSLGIGSSILAALLSLTRYRKTLEQVCPPSEDKDCCYPQLHRSECNIRLGLVSPIVLPIIFCVAWIGVILLNTR
jgi:hypothetical protein